MRASLSLIVLAALPGAAFSAAPATAGDDPVFLAVAADSTAIAAAEPPPAEAPAGLVPLDAREVRLADFLWVARPVVVFADSPADPLFVRQMRYLSEGWADLAARDVVVIVDTDPAARSDARQRLRPRGFSLVFVDKDGDVKQRKPQPWTARELAHAIDRTPIRRQELQELLPAGR